MNELTHGVTRHWVDGARSDHVRVVDRGLQYGDGVFETIRVRDGVARFLPLHLQRLRAGCERLQIGPINYPQIEQEIRDAVRRIDAGIAKLIVTRGPATQRGYSGAGCITPTRVLSLSAGLPSIGSAARVGISEVTLGENPLLAGIKHLNRLESVLARSAMSDTLDEVLLRSSEGTVVCGSMCNIFLVRSRQLLTPRLDRCGVMGIMRSVVMREATGLGIETLELPLSVADLSAADEIFLTNARVGVWPVSRMQSRALAAGSITRVLQARVEALDGSR